MSANHQRSPHDVDPVAIQRAYYADTAAQYTDAHDAREHDVALGHIIGFAQWLGAKSLLDTGCGTGRAMRTITSALPHIEVRGNDPSQALLDVAVERFGIPADRLDCVPSHELPYADQSFDFVVATGIMHHLPNPDVVLENMLRVARQAIFVSDCNMYGQGSLAARCAKVLLSRTSLLDFVNRRRRGGHAWVYLEGDGVVWNYSVYDSAGLVRRWCADVLVIPTRRTDEVRSTTNPRLWSSHALLCGFKERLPRAVEGAWSPPPLGSVAAV